MQLSVLRTRDRSIAKTSKTSKTGVALWVVQSLLAALFLFAGPVKFTLPPEMFASGPVAFPAAFMYFIGSCETLGALGLILPGLTRIRPGLTPLAAGGLVIIMIGATVTTAIGGDVLPALFPLLVGVLCAAVAYGRSRLAPHRSRRARPASQAAVAAPVAAPVAYVPAAA